MFSGRISKSIMILDLHRADCEVIRFEFWLNWVEDGGRFERSA
jgi:hypothetical protein